MIPVFSWKPSLLAAAVAIAATVIVLHRLDREQAATAAETRRTGTEQMRNREPAPAGERRETPFVGQVEPAAAAVAVSARRPRTGETSAPVNEGAYLEAGRTTPGDALHTLAWLCDRADAKALAGLLVLEPVARERIDAYFARLPPGMRAQWLTPEEMAASLYISSAMMRPFPAAAILDLAEEEEAGPDRVRMRLRGTAKDGLLFQRGPDGWRPVITDKLVETYLAEIPSGAGG